MLYNILSTELSETIKNHIFWGSEATNKIIMALDNSLINNKLSISTVHWAKQYPIEIKRISMVLSELGFCNSIVTAKWNELQLIPAKLLEFVSQDEIDQYKIDWMLDEYLMRLDKEVYPDNVVRLNGKVKPNGAIKSGFAKCAKNEFKLDRTTLAKYRTPILKTLVKSIEKSIAKGTIKDKFFDNKANYQRLANLSIDYYINNDESYNSERNIGDSRNRSNYQVLKRIFNYTSSKDCRALLVVPEPLMLTLDNKLAMDDIYYFIAELAGIKSKLTTEQGKIFAGKVAYKTRRLPTIDLESEEDRKDLHELIWLERIYAKLDTLFANGTVAWDIPLEVDGSQSISQIIAALTNEVRLMERTNMIGKQLSDPWFISGVPRLHGKKVLTPRFYGSSASATKLLKKNNIEPVASEIKAINTISSEGEFGILNKLKNAIISNYSNKQPTITVKLWNDTFIIECNKFKVAGAKLLVTEAWDSKQKKFRKSITREPQYVPDYKYFALYFQTLFVHGLDNQVMDNIAKLINEWMLTIHDACIALAGTCGRIRGLYANQLQQIHTDRFSIMRNFRESIGATSMKADMDFMELYKSVQQAPDDVQFLRTAMK